jgi:plastocyanin domain-containing protein
VGKKEDEMKRRSFIFFAAVFFVAASLALAAADWKEKKLEAVADKDGVQKVEIMAGGYYFDPNVIVVKVNVPVELVVKRTSGGFGHNIVLHEPEAGIDFQEALGTDPKSIKFTPTKAGKYMFICSHKVPFSKSHQERGMYGYLEVVE